MRLTLVFLLDWHERFNPRTHMGCDLITTANEIIELGFNPRTHMGCDPYAPFLRLGRAGFNPRTHMGCDSGIGDVNIINVTVSIHAPTWGATQFKRKGYRHYRFQSTHPHGVRPPQLKQLKQKTMFQSTHPHGVRRSPS